MYKMICIDIDGTLVRPDLSISPRVKEAIKKAKKKGVVVALSTGRMHNSALLYSDELGLQDPIVSSNGAFVSAKEGETIYYEENLPLEDILSIQQVLDRYNVRINWYNHGTMYVSEYRDYVGRYEEMAKVLPENRRIYIKYITETFSLDEILHETGNKIQKGIVFPDPQVIPSIKEEVMKNPNIKVVSSGPDNVEFTSKTADKGLGVLALAKALGIEAKEIIAVGDSENDLPMLEVVGLPVAMGNAMDEVKNVAKFVTKSNVEDGVAVLIEKYILHEGQQLLI